VTAPDSATVTVLWKRAYVAADTLFSGKRGLPLPRHLLEREYVENRAGFLALPYWGPQFVGAGAFRIRELVSDSHLVLVAHDDFVLGRPRIDEIEVRFLQDENAVIANVLAGTVDMTLASKTLSFDVGRQLSDRWREGRLQYPPAGVVTERAQFLNPRPAILSDARFRRALVHALDRQEMADSIQGGLADVAHSHIGPHMGEYSYVERSIVRYDYDPRKAALMIQDLGYTRGSDGSFRNAMGERLVIEQRFDSDSGVVQKAAPAAADYWQRLGIGVDLVAVPSQLQDPEYTATFPGLTVGRVGTNDPTRFQQQHSSRAALAENNFRGANWHRYMNPEFDALVDRYFTSIALKDRMQVMSEVVHHDTDQIMFMYLFYDPEATALSNRLKDIAGQPWWTIPGGSPWNPHLWDMEPVGR
jgi:peptide/nickel transport system substrate-binding protein